MVTKEILDKYYAETFDFERFRRNDPCGVVYELCQHTDNQLDIEIGALLVAMISWGSRKVIIPTAIHMIRDVMHWHPASFIRMGCYETAYEHAPRECVYRTLNVSAFRAVCRNLRTALEGYETMEQALAGKTSKEAIESICTWLQPAKAGTMGKSPCKRICMFLRWMVRREAPDFGIWKNRPLADLYAVLDTHVLQLTRGLITPSSSPSWRTVEELTSVFKQWDAIDPLHYDIALMTMADHPVSPSDC